MSYDEKRRFERAIVDIYVHWGWTPECSFTDRIINISVGGCFLRTSHSGERGRRVYVRFWLPEEITLSGDVRYLIEPMGLGLAFVNIDEDQTRLLESLVEHYAGQTGESPSPLSRQTHGR